MNASRSGHRSSVSLDGKACREGSIKIFEMSDGENVILQGNSQENQLYLPYTECAAILLPQLENKNQHIKFEFLALSIKNCGVRVHFYSSPSLDFRNGIKENEVACGAEIPRPFYSESKDCVKVILDIDPEMQSKDYYFFIINASLVNSEHIPKADNTQIILTVLLCFSTLAGIVILVLCMIKHYGRKLKNCFLESRTSIAMNNARMLATSFPSVDSVDMSENSSQICLEQTDGLTNCQTHVRGVFHDRLIRRTGAFQPRVHNADMQKVVFFANNDTNNTSSDNEEQDEGEQDRQACNIHLDTVISQIIDEEPSNQHTLHSARSDRDIHQHTVVSPVINTDRQCSYEMSISISNNDITSTSRDQIGKPSDKPPSYEEALYMPQAFVQTQSDDMHPIYQNV